MRSNHIQAKYNMEFWCQLEDSESEDSDNEDSEDHPWGLVTIGRS